MQTPRVAAPASQLAWLTVFVFALTGCSDSTTTKPTGKTEILAANSTGTESAPAPTTPAPATNPVETKEPPPPTIDCDKLLTVTDLEDVCRTSLESFVPDQMETRQGAAYCSRHGKAAKPETKPKTKIKKPSAPASKDGTLRMLVGIYPHNTAQLVAPGATSTVATVQHTRQGGKLLTLASARKGSVVVTLRTSHLATVTPICDEKALRTLATRAAKRL